jgi:putative peptide zinc metalloprotease protein
MSVARNIWAALPTKSAARGVWHRALPAPARALTPGEPNVWSILGNRPGGMWHDLASETLLVRAQDRRDLWREVNEETLILRPRRDLWRELQAVGPTQSADLGLWAQASDKTLRVAPPHVGLWSGAAQGESFTQQRPMRRMGWALKKLQTAGGEEYFVLKNMRTGTYLRLSEPQVFLWNLMDGEHTVQDLAVAYFIQYKALAIDGLLTFLGQLEARGFLAASHTNVYSTTAGAIRRGRIGPRLYRLWQALTSATISIRGLDRWFAALYRFGGFLLFTRAAQVIILSATMAGLVAYAVLALGGKYSILTGGGQHASLGLLGLYVAQMAALFAHETAHALACKHYKREVRRAGFLLYLGMPSFFVDTTDIWMEPRRPRLLVSWAGPYSGFFLASLASLLALVTPDPFVGGLLFQFASACNLVSFFNLNPLLQLDGYYILMDWLEMPLLRARAINFVQSGLWRRLRRHEPFGKEERIFTVFGSLALVWTVSALWSTLRFFGGTILRFFQSTLGATAGVVVGGALVALLAALLFWPLVGNLLTARRRRVVAA